MYEPFLLLHSWTRWLVLLPAVYFFVKSVAGAAGYARWSAGENYFIWAFNQVFGYQVLFGLSLWLGASPIVKAAFRTPAIIFEDATIGFWTLRHPLTMIAALGVFHIGKAKAKRVEIERKFKYFAVTFGVILLLIASAIPWPWLTYGRPLLRWFA